MNKFVWMATLLAAAPAFAGDVGVSITVDQPGLYGRVDIGNVPPPQVVYPQPVLVAPPAYGLVAPAPIYLRVPPGYARHWRRHCREYDACGRPVYFVRDGWYNDVYVPARRKFHEREGNNGYSREHENHRGGDRGDRGERRGAGHGDHGDHGDRDHQDRDR